MTEGELFGENYYEHGVTTKTSGYEDYHYMPTRSYEEAIALDDELVWGTVLDWGCAKGYLVHALRQLGIDAYGFDISEYAVDNCHPRVKDYVFNSEVQLEDEYDTIICKDVMEHVPEEEVPTILRKIKSYCRYQALFIIPLGDNDKFRIREYEIDVTHVTKKDEDWWIDKFREAGFTLEKFSYSLGSIKKKWKEHEHGNGFFRVRV
jgi:SAM-dependent methyltransferase